MERRNIKHISRNELICPSVCYHSCLGIENSIPGYIIQRTCFPISRSFSIVMSSKRGYMILSGCTRDDLTWVFSNLSHLNLQNSRPYLKKIEIFLSARQSVGRLQMEKSAGQSLGRLQLKKNPSTGKFLYWPVF